MKVLDWWLQYAYNTVVICIVLLALIIAGSNLGWWGKSYRLYSVRSGSMRPSLSMGSLVAVRPAAEYARGDIVTYRVEGKAGETITHRIVEKKTDGQTAYITKGDANEDADSEPVPEGSLVGKVVWSMPLIGYPVAAAQSKQGFIFLIVIPATIIIYSEAVAIIHEIGTHIRKRRERRLKAQEKLV